MGMNQVFLTDKEMVRLLHEAGLRPSVHRMAVLAYMANFRNHPTAEEIYAHLTQYFPNVSKTTVYNSLHALKCAGLVRELDIESGSARYDMASYKPHAHFTCRICGKIFDMPLPDKLETIVSEGFQTESIDLHFKGVCPECMQTEKVGY